MRGGRAIWAIAWSEALALVACFSPAPPSGAPCASNDECPAPYACIANQCIVPTSSSIDGSLPGGGDDKAIVPSNGVPASLVDGTSDIAIASDVTLDTDTGAITGGLVRAGDTGIASGIAFATIDDPVGGLGVFAMHALTIASPAHVRFTGRHAAVLLVATAAAVAGTVDVSARCDDTSQHCGGPGGGAGGAFGAMNLRAVDACAGSNGLSDAGTTNDTGGGGGGGGSAGALGGVVQTFAGGAGGSACIGESIEPLVGGGGGGGGGPGLTGQPSRGGGGGGALQLDVLAGPLTFSGTIVASGGGGEGGVGNNSGNAGAGAGGGAGGAIVVEAIVIVLSDAGVIAANGGGGGGGANQMDSGKIGQGGRASTMAASGGPSGAAPATNGGNGGAMLPPTTPADLTVMVGNAGGGGGAAGRIRLSAVQPISVAGAISPPPELTIPSTRP